MVKRHYHSTVKWVSRRRFQLLLIATVLVLIIPAFSGTGRLAELIFWFSMAFLYIQSTIVADVKKSRRIWAWLIVISLILISLLKPVGIDSHFIELLKLILIAWFFTYVLYYLFRFIRNSSSVTLEVLITAVNIYLLFGIIASSLAFMFYKIYPDAYNFPGYIDQASFVTFLYYSFITMSTVGYGDIVPKIPETQTLAYFIAVSGQLYLAIIVAFLVGKFLVGRDQK